MDEHDKAAAEPDQIDMMDEHELRDELRETLLKLSTLEVERSMDRKLLDAEQERIKELVGRLDSETNRANHEERLRRSAETCAGSMSKSLENEIRNSAALALEADHQRKCAKEWFDRMQAAESRLGRIAKLIEGPHPVPRTVDDLDASLALLTSIVEQVQALATGAPEVNSKSRLKRLAVQRGGELSDAAVETEVRGFRVERSARDIFPPTYSVCPVCGDEYLPGPEHACSSASGVERQCTCHPDDNPPRPCPQKFALTECREAAAARRESSLCACTAMHCHEPEYDGCRRKASNQGRV